MTYMVTVSVLFLFKHKKKQLIYFLNKYFIN